jgi:hypothetical protein
MKISPAVLKLLHAYRRPEQTQQAPGRVANATEMLKTISMPHVKQAAISIWSQNY